MEFIYDGISLQNGRDSNMDSLLMTGRQVSGVQTVLAVVCDGVGSMSDGAYAGVESVKMLNEWFKNLTDLERVGLRLRDEVQSINVWVTRAAKEQGIQTATTLSALLLAERQFFIVHAGDSRIYSISSDSAQLLTVDAVTESGQLTTYIGRHEDLELFYTEGVTQCGVFLICSDGLYKRVHIEDELIAGSIDTSNAKAIHKTLKVLTDVAIERGENDNVSLGIVKIK